MKLCLVIAGGREVRESAKNIVEEMGFLSAEAEDGHFAYVACQALMPDIVILDLDTPNIEAMDFVGKIKKLKRGKAPVIFCCLEDAKKDLADKLIEAGANDCVLKPFELDNFVEKLLD